MKTVNQLQKLYIESRFFWHVMKITELENIVTTCTFDGEMSKGRLQSYIPEWQNTDLI